MQYDGGVKPPSEMQGGENKSSGSSEVGTGYEEGSDLSELSDLGTGDAPHCNPQIFSKIGDLKSLGKWLLSLDSGLHFCIFPLELHRTI